MGASRTFRDAAILSVLMTVIGFGILVTEVVGLPAAHRRDVLLERDGVTVPATVIVVLERGRTNEPLTVRVRLPDDREATVDLVSDVDEHEPPREVGSTFDLRFVRDDPSTNRPASHPPEVSRRSLAFLIFPAGAGLTGLVLGVVLLLRRRSDA